METIRRHYVVEIRNEISRLEKYQQRDQEVLRNLSNLNLPSTIFQEKKTNLNETIDKRIDTIFNLQTKEKDILSGKHDQEFLKNAADEKEKQKKAMESAKKKKKDLHIEEEDKQNTMFSKQKDGDGKDRQIKSDYRYFYKVYQKINESLPEYMRENLKTMPNNKGYIWRDCWFFGDMKTNEKYPIILFEKLRNGILRIIEIDTKETRTFEKKGKDRKKLISIKPKVNKKERRRYKQ